MQAATSISPDEVLVRIVTSGIFHTRNRESQQRIATE